MILPPTDTANLLCYKNGKIIVSNFRRHHQKLSEIVLNHCKRRLCHKTQNHSNNPTIIIITFHYLGISAFESTDTYIPTTLDYCLFFQNRDWHLSSTTASVSLPRRLYSEDQDKFVSRRDVAINHQRRQWLHLTSATSSSRYRRTTGEPCQDLVRSRFYRP